MFPRFLHAAAGDSCQQHVHVQQGHVHVPQQSRTPRKNMVTAPLRGRASKQPWRHPKLGKFAHFVMLQALEKG